MTAGQVTILTVGVLAGSTIGSLLSVTIQKLLAAVWRRVTQSVTVAFCIKQIPGRALYRRITSEGMLLWDEGRTVVNVSGENARGLPLHGQLLILWRGVPISVGATFDYDGDMTGGSMELVTLRPWRSELRRHISDAIEMDRVPTAERACRVVNLMTFSHSADGINKCCRRIYARNFSTVELDPPVEQELRGWISTFRNSEALYRQRGMSWRTGILLHGPPGTGKTSIAQAIAHEHDLPMISLSLSQLTDEDLPSCANNSTVYVIEDLSAMNFGTQEEGVRHSTGVTLSGLLNFLDGLWTPDGAIFIFTANVLPKLDEALTRPGRIDKCIEIGYGTRDQIRRMWKRFHPELEELADEFAMCFGERAHSMASVEEVLKMHYTAEGALRHARTAARLRGQDEAA